MHEQRPTRPYSSATVRSMQPDETVQEFAARMRCSGRRSRSGRRRQRRTRAGRPSRW